MTVGAIVFDLDGVIVDSEIWWDEVRRDLVAAHGGTWSEDDRRAVMGANSATWARLMVARHGLGGDPVWVERAVVDAMVSRYVQRGAPFIPGVVEAVRALAARYRLGVASSAHRRVIDAALEASGIRDVFEVVVSSDEVAHGKPAPDVFLLAAARFGVPPERVVVFEDSLNGVLAAKAAGMTAVLVPNATIPPVAGAVEAADLVASSIAEVDPEEALAHRRSAS